MSKCLTNSPAQAGIARVFALLGLLLIRPDRSWVEESALGSVIGQRGVRIALNAGCRERRTHKNESAESKDKLSLHGSCVARADFPILTHSRSKSLTINRGRSKHSPLSVAATQK